MRAAFVLSLLLVGCSGSVTPPCPIGALTCECTQGGGCDPGLVCGPTRTCASPERVDAGQGDAGGVDSGTPDAGLPDGGRTDGGLPDAGRTDGGSLDAGLPPLRIGVVLMNSDDNSIPYMNGFGGDAGMPVALHVVNFGGVETSSGGWTVLANRIDRVTAAHALPVIHVATVPQEYSLGGTAYGIENHWDPSKVANFAQTLAPILSARGVTWVVFGNEGKESNYFTTDAGIAEYISNFGTFEATLRPLVPGVQIYAPYTTGGITQAQQEHAWGSVIDALGPRMDGLAWDQASGDYDSTKWEHNQTWLEQKDPTGRLHIWLTEWYPGTPTSAAQNAWQICRLAMLERYVMSNFWAPNGDGMSGAILWNKSSGGGAGKTALFDTISRAVEFVQHRPITAVGDTFTNALGRTLTVDRAAGTVVFQ
jgi:hypothetical protein